MPLVSSIFRLSSFRPSPVARWPGRLCPRRVVLTGRRSEGFACTADLSKRLYPTGSIVIIGPAGYKGKASWVHFPDFSGMEGPMSAEWFAARLRELRTEAGLTQDQLAE